MGLWPKSSNHDPARDAGSEDERAKCYHLIVAVSCLHAEPRTKAERSRRALDHLRLDRVGDVDGCAAQVVAERRDYLPVGRTLPAV